MEQALRYFLANIFIFLTKQRFDKVAVFDYNDGNNQLWKSY